MVIPTAVPTMQMDRISLEQTSLRRVPSQQRSRERVERMLEVAARMIAEDGSDALRMSEVAKRAGVSIGSLYQYFPDKSAILHTLAEHYNAECRRCIEVALAEADSIDELCAAFEVLVDEYYALYLAEPVIRDIRSGTLADKALRDLEVADSRENGAVLCQALLRVKPKADAAKAGSACFFIMHIGEATMRLAISVDRAEGNELVESYKNMALAELRRL